MSAPNVYNDALSDAYVFEAATLAELQRWSVALHATPLADRLMASALPDPALRPLPGSGPTRTAAQQYLEEVEAREAALAKAQVAIDASTLRALKASEEMERRLKAAAIPVTFTRPSAPATRTSKGGDLDPSRPPPPSSPATPAQRAAASVVARQLSRADPPPHAPSESGATASARAGSARSDAGSMISSVDHNQAASGLARSTSWDRLTGGRLGGRSRVDPGAARASEENVIVTNPLVHTVLGPMMVVAPSPTASPSEEPKPDQHREDYLMSLDRQQAGDIGEI